MLRDRVDSVKHMPSRLDLREPEAHLVVAGDWHTDVQFVEQAIASIATEAPGTRTILQLGDFDIWPDAHHAQYLERIDRWCQEAGIQRILVTPGNHDNWAMLTSAFEKRRITPNLIGTPVRLSRTVRVLPRGYRFRLGGRLFFSFGGAHSTHNFMQPGWQQGEQIRDYHVRWATKGIGRAGQVDVLLAHETIGGTPAVDRILQSNPRGYSPDVLNYSALGRHYVDWVWRQTQPRLMLHGHMHVADEATLDTGQRIIALGPNRGRGNLGVLDLEGLGWRWLDGPALSPPPRKLGNPIGFRVDPTTGEPVDLDE